MSWLKKHQPTILHQTSDVPYIVLDKSVYLCYDNFYTEKQDTSSGFSINFKTHPRLLQRKDTNYFEFIKFPVRINLSDVNSVNNSKDTYITTTTDISNIVLVKHKYIKKISNAEIDEFTNIIEDFDARFVLVPKDSDYNERTRMFEDNCEFIDHYDWFKTLTTICHKICNSKTRENEWIKSIPEVSIDCYGVFTSKEISSIQSAVDDLELDFSLNFIS